MRNLFEFRILRLFKWDISRVEINYSFDGPFLQFMESLLNLQEWWRLLLNTAVIMCIIFLNSFYALCFIMIEFFQVFLFGRLHILYEIIQSTGNLLVGLMVRYYCWRCVFIFVLLLMDFETLLTKRECALLLISKEMYWENKNVRWVESCGSNSVDSFLAQIFID